MSAQDRRVKLRVAVEDEFEIVVLNLHLETQRQLREGDEHLEWVEEDSSPIQILRMRTMLLIALLTLFVTGVSLVT